MERKFTIVYWDECFHCKKSGELGKDLHLHHPIAQVIEPNDNVLPYCTDCHSLAHHIDIRNSGEMSKFGVLKSKVQKLLDNSVNTIKKSSKEEICPDLCIADITKRNVIRYLRQMYKIDAISIITKVSVKNIKAIELDWKSKNFVNG